MKKLTKFQGEKIEFIETIEVREGVFCDVYKFCGSDEKDLAIVEVKAGFSTPLQKVLKGKRTIEELIDGEGTFVVTDSDGNQVEHHQTFENHEPVEVKVGDLMKWTAKTDMFFSEICYPPYQDGRYKNLN